VQAVIQSAKVANIDRRVNSGVSKVFPVRNTTLLGSTKDKYKNASVKDRPSEEKEVR
jgi:hypothetical protein